MAIAAIVGSPVVDEISAHDPDLVSAGGSRTWSVRGRNFVVAVTELEAGDRLTEHDLPDEYVLLVQDDAVVGVEHDGRGLVSVPDSALVLAGRLLWNYWPTGVTVSWAQQHGGPYPATTAPTTTSVGTAAIDRFLRPVAWQGFPDTLLPPPIQEANPWHLPRRTDGEH